MKFLQVPPLSETDEQWTMKNGQKIAVCDMSEQHAKNALRMMIRQASFHKLEQGAKEFYEDFGHHQDHP